MRSEHLNKDGIILVACRDTGAANELAAFVKLCREEISVSLGTLCVGPAVDVFKEAGITPTMEFTHELDCLEVHQALDRLQPKVIILGTSHDSWTERFILEYGRDQGIYCLGVVDWWSNFGRRFSTPGTGDLRYLPDAICIMDEDARQGCIADGISSTLLHVVGNPYWDYLLTISDEVRRTTRMKVREKLGIPNGAVLVLAISSNLRNLNLDLGYDETDFWRAIIPLPNETTDGRPIIWSVKPHPREQRHDLETMLDIYDARPLFIEGFSAFEAVNAADYIIGMCSSVLFEAALLGKPVVSLQPGVTESKLDFLRIFDHLEIPKIIREHEARDIVYQLINGRIPCPNLNKVPFKVEENNAYNALLNLLPVTQQC